MDSRPSLGLVGVGNVGEYFVQWLTDAGYELTVYDVDDDRVASAVEMGASAGDDAADVAASSDIILLSLPGSQYVETVMEGEDGVLEMLSEGQLVVDTGTSRPDTVAHYADVCEQRDAGFVDAPLTWGGPGSYTEEHGPAFTMFVGGTTEQYERLTPILDVVSHSHDHFEGTANGMVAKTAHRMRQTTEAVMNAEFVAYLENNDVDPAAMDDLLAMDLSERYYADDPPGDDVDEDDREKGYRLEPMAARTRLRLPHWTKDPQYARDVARSSNTAVPLLTAALSALEATEQYASARSDRDIVFQDPEWKHEDVIHHYRRLNDPQE